MPNTILLKRNATIGVSPASLASGELAINSAETKLYAKNSSGVIVPIVKTEDRVLDGGVISPNVIYSSYGSMLNGSADYIGGDKWAAMDSASGNATWSVTLSVQYLVINGVLLVANNADVPDPLFGRLLSDDAPLTLVLNSSNLPTYGSYSPYTSTEPTKYIDFINNLWDAAQYISSTTAPANWKAGGGRVYYSLPSTTSFHVILKEAIIKGSGSYFGADGEIFYEIRTKKVQNETAQRIEDRFTDSNWHTWT